MPINNYNTENTGLGDLAVLTAVKINGSSAITQKTISASVDIFEQAAG
ncbi:MAG: hypothetical protein QNJ54_06760 [Prochloraceae cyanobacterium]|nr:hypothetical protein [Prochloraceae cyanobacterium]